MATSSGRGIVGAGGFLDSPALANVRRELATNPVARALQPPAAIQVTRPDPIEALKAKNQQTSLVSRLASTNRWGQQMTDLKRAAVRQGMAARPQAQVSMPRQQGGGGNYAVPVSRGVSTRGTQGINGRLDPKTLSGVSFAKGALLDRKAAAALEQMNAAYRAATGRNIGITDSYRSLQGQINVARSKPNLAAKPGTSVHGLGKALDLNVRGDPQLKRWLDQNGHRWGYVNPAWAKNKKRFEPWHWEFVG